MTIEKIVSLVNGSLNENSKVLKIQNATVYNRKVDDQTLFISDNQEEIDEAIKSGAKAILYADEITITSPDLAWIKVDDIELASFNIAEYVVSDEDASFYYLKPREIVFFKMIALYQRDIEYLGDDWKKVFEKVLNSRKKIFIGSDIELMKKLRKKVKVLTRKVDGYIISDTLFRTTFRIGKYVYQYKKFAPIHIDHLLKVIAFCEDNLQEYSIDKVRYFNGFMPLFIEGEPSLNEYSKNNRIVIVSDDLDDISKARDYAKEPSGWVVKTAVLTPPKTKIDGIVKPIYYRNYDDVLDILQGSNFNYAFIYSDDANMINMIKKEYNL
jgi:ferrochelatase